MTALMAPARFFCLLILSGVAKGAVHQETPVERVIKLLKALDAQITGEGKLEAAQYDKYACFCKEESDDKLHSVRKSAKAIEKLNAEIEALSTEIAPLSGKISELVQKVSKLEEAVAVAVHRREEEHAHYLHDAGELDWCISALSDAVEALRASKERMTDEKLDLVQLRAVAARVLQRMLGVSSSVPPSGAQLAAVQVLLGGQQSPITYHSNDIIATLQGLLVQFKLNRREIDEFEVTAKGAFEKEKSGILNQKSFAEKEEADTKSLLGMKEAQLGAAKIQLHSVTEGKVVEEHLLEELTSVCEEKARLFDQRSQTRAGELTAMHKAVVALESGAIPSYDAIGKAGYGRGSGHALSLLQQGSASAAAVRWRPLPTHSKKGARLAKAVSLLNREARSLGSPTLATLSMKAFVQIDHFAKVRSLIRDFLERLEADAVAESDTKSYCDHEMSKETAARDEWKQVLEQTVDSETEAQIAQWGAEVQTLSKEISGHYRALKEAKELRSAERAANAKTHADAEGGVESVKYAIVVLEDFYESTALLQGGRRGRQRQGPYRGGVPAPEIFDDEYHGKHAATGGVIGILDMILSDFHWTIETVEEEEHTAQAEFDAFRQETEEGIKVKEEGIKETKAQIADATDVLSHIKQQHMDAKEALDVALAELENLRGLCIEGGDVWRELSERREKEVSALKEALHILDDWKHEDSPESIQGVVDSSMKVKV